MKNLSENIKLKLAMSAIIKAWLYQALKVVTPLSKDPLVIGEFGVPWSTSPMNAGVIVTDINDEGYTISTVNVFQLGLPHVEVKVGYDTTPSLIQDFRWKEFHSKVGPLQNRALYELASKEYMNVDLRLEIVDGGVKVSSAGEGEPFLPVPSTECGVPQPDHTKIYRRESLTRNIFHYAMDEIPSIIEHLLITNDPITLDRMLIDAPFCFGKRHSIKLTIVDSELCLLVQLGDPSTAFSVAIPSDIPNRIHWYQNLVGCLKELTKPDYFTHTEAYNMVKGPAAMIKDLCVGFTNGEVDYDLVVNESVLPEHTKRTFNISTKNPKSIEILK